MTSGHRTPKGHLLPEVTSTDMLLAIPRIVYSDHFTPCMLSPLPSSFSPYHVGEKLGDVHRRMPACAKASHLGYGHTVLGRITGGDRLGDLGSPGLLNIINSRFSSNNRVTPSIDLPPWRMQASHRTYDLWS